MRVVSEAEVSKLFGALALDPVGTPDPAAPHADLARLAGMLAGTSAWIRDLEGACIGQWGPVDMPEIDLGSGDPREEVVVPDTTQDERLALHPAVVGAPFLRSWARFPLLVSRSNIHLSCSGSA
jgi:hypothetical protein